MIKIAEKSNPYQRIKRATVSEGIVNQIHALITKGILKPGDRLPSERELCKRFGVGRTSVREALKPLITMGLLEGRMGSGTFVAAETGQINKSLQWGLLGDLQNTGDLVETRQMLETNAAYWAAERASEENLRLIGATVAGMEINVKNPKIFQKLDADFHFEIAQATQNKLLFRLINVIRGQIQTWIGERLAIDPDRSEILARTSLAQHKKIFAAIEGRDGSGARAAMALHIQTATQDLAK